MRMRFVLSMVAVILGISLISPLLQPSHATAISTSQWKAGDIIDDAIFANPGNMSVTQIQDFLNSKVGTGAYGKTPGQCDTNGTATSEYGGGTRAQFGAANGNPAPFTCLKDYYEVPKTSPSTVLPASNYGGKPIPAGAKSAAQLIYDAAQRYSISPKVLLVLIQKESTGPLTTDDWPFEYQYKYAMGAHCPDSTGCDPNYAGFSIQVSEAAKLFRYYLDNMTQSWWPYRKLGVNTIAYNPSSSCGSSDVNITTSATAALYTYTPYQPNAAALAAGYGTGDSCSSYGNRNFWLIFNDWFGTSYNRVSYVQVQGGSAQYILYDGKKQALTYDGLLAWGINKLPLSQLSATTLDQIPNTPNSLTRYAQIDGTTSRVFADDGNYYDVNSNLAQTWNNFNNTAVSTIGWKVLDIAIYRGNLPSLVQLPGDATYYAMEAGKLLPFASTAARNTWFGANPGVITLSGTYSQPLVKGTAISHNIISNGSNLYYVDNRRALTISPAISKLLSSYTPTPISNGSLARYSVSGPLSHLIRSTDQTTIYAIDDSQKHAIKYFDVFNALRNSGAAETQVSSDALSLLPTGSTFSSAVLNATGTSNYYLAATTLAAIPTRIANEMGASTFATTVSSDFLALFKTNQSDVTQFIKQPSSSGVYLLNNGKKQPINRYDVLVLLGGQNSITTIDGPDFNAIPSATTPVTPLVSLQGSSQVTLLDTKTAFNATSTDTTLFSDWNVATTTPTVITQATMDWLTSSRRVVPLTQTIQTSNGEFCFVDHTRTCAEQFATIYIWNLLPDVMHPSDELLGYTNVVRSGALSLFVSSFSNEKYSNNVFVMIDGMLHYVTTPSELANLGFNGKITHVSAATIDKLKGLEINGYLFNDGTASWVLDGAAKRQIPSNLIPNWTSTSLSPLNVSTYFTSTYPTLSPVTKSVTTNSTGTVYGMDSGLKRGITTYQKYQQGWAPYTTISLDLFTLIPDGAVI